MPGSWIVLAWQPPSARGSGSGKLVATAGVALAAALEGPQTPVAGSAPQHRRPQHQHQYSMHAPQHVAHPADAQGCGSDPART